MLSGKYKQLNDILVPRIDKRRIFHDPLYTLAYGNDASFYRLIPKMVIKAADENEVSLIMREASALSLPVTFRAAGTSLSGQAITGSVLVIAGDHWKQYRIEDDGKKICLQPGLIGGHVNALLLPYGRKMGPDPASINAAMIGGIAANNASGMCCGTAENSYKTLDSIRIVLADGTSLDTGDVSSRESFRGSHPDMLEKISKLAVSVKGNTPLAERITGKFRMKNTTGYSLNALVDFDDPFDIIAHLMIGSEGTLGFISEVRYRTVVEHPCRASSLMIFPDIEKACIAVSLLKPTPVAAVELIDRAGLRSVEDQPGIPEHIRRLDDDACALLVETTAHDENELRKQIGLITGAVSPVETVVPVTFTGVPSEYLLLWKIRKGLFPSVGAIRKSGTTVIIEDVAFPVPRLAEATLDLQALLRKYRYDEAVIFGHALEGNLHFVFTQDFSTPEEIDRYSRFMDEIARMVVNKYDGSLKAEHGTGRNMAPFVEMEWGSEAYALMKEIKQIFDPDNLLNPGVILNSDPEIHLKDLKPIPEADEIVDKCMDCGFCEVSCVSSGLTLTPRQRIVVYRELASLRENGHEPHIAASLARSFRYAGDATCATDGLCGISCPVDIDTGKLIKRVREAERARSRKTAGWIAGHMKQVTGTARVVLSFVRFFHIILGTTVMNAISGMLRRISFGLIPRWNPFMPGGARKIKVASTGSPGGRRTVVYFPSCMNRSMGVSADHREEVQLSEKVIALLHKAGYEVVYPEDLDKLCCGMAFMSKGYTEAGLHKSAELESALLRASNNGEYPVLCDMSPCLFTMKENMGEGLRLFEPVEFINDHLLPWLEITPVDETITVFPVCSMKKMGLEDKLVELARKCATRVVVPETNCCGFAGDRGFSYPELNRHGLRELKAQINPHGIRDKKVRLKKHELRGKDSHKNEHGLQGKNSHQDEHGFRGNNSHQKEHGFRGNNSHQEEHGLHGMETRLDKDSFRGNNSRSGGDVTGGYSNSRTCEIGLTLHSGISHKSIVYLVDRVSLSKKKK